jgi:predicted ATPase/DNA-binding SARP family transcriptional activator
LLALRTPARVTDDELVRALWGGEPPPSATKTLQSLVSRLRSSSPHLPVVRTGGGYRLDLPPSEVDANQFEDLIERGRTALRDGDVAGAAELLGAAGALWRGAPVPDLAEAWPMAEVVRLEELRRGATEDLAEARLGLGQHAELIGDLEAAVVDEPLRERRWAQLMLALHRDGRRPEALRAYQRARQHLGEGLGLEPSAELTRLERAITTDDPSLHLGVTPPRVPIGTHTGELTLTGAGPGLGDVGTGPDDRLPLSLTTFVGRNEDRRAVAKRLAEARLVTLSGPGGVGKTRLAIEVAREVSRSSAGEVWFVDLTAVGDPTGVAATVATAVGARVDPGRSPSAALAARLADVEALVLLDNCEHVIDAVAELVGDVLPRATGLRIVATSRERLAVPGEVVVPLAPLATPPPGVTDLASLAQCDAVRLFSDRASAVDPVFDLDDGTAVAVAALCRRLDGLPLAIELAAAQVDVLSPGQIERRLDDHPQVLQNHQRGGTQRHRTLDGVLDWSYELLDERERAVLDRLAVFRGSSSLEAIEAVVPDEDLVGRAQVLEILVRLVRRSLVVAEGRGSDRRYRLLETVRAYAWHHLERAGDVATWRDRHLEWVSAVASEAGAALAGGGDQAAWLVRLDEDLDNLEEALAWSVLDPARAEQALGLVLGLFNYWMARGTRRRAGVRWCVSLARAATETAVGARVDALWNACFLAGQSDARAAVELADAASDLVRGVEGDDQATAITALAHGVCALIQADGEGIATLAELDVSPLEGMTQQFARYFRSWARTIRGDGEAAYREARDLVSAWSAGGDEHLAAGTIGFVADMGLHAGVDREVLRADARSALGTTRKIPCASCESGVLSALVMLDPCPDLGGPVGAARLAFQRASEIDEVATMIQALDVLVGAQVVCGDPHEAVVLAGAASSLRRRSGFGDFSPARVRYRDQALARAARELGEAYATAWATGAELEYADLVARVLQDLRA